MKLIDAPPAPGAAAQKSAQDEAEVVWANLDWLYEVDQATARTGPSGSDDTRWETSEVEDLATMLL